MAPSTKRRKDGHKGNPSFLSPSQFGGQKGRWQSGKSLVVVVAVFGPSLSFFQGVSWSGQRGSVSVLPFPRALNRSHSLDPPPPSPPSDAFVETTSKGGGGGGYWKNKKKETIRKGEGSLLSSPSLPLLFAATEVSERSKEPKSLLAIGELERKNCRKGPATLHSYSSYDIFMMKLLCCARKNAHSLFVGEGLREFFSFSPFSSFRRKEDESPHFQGLLCK